MGSVLLTGAIFVLLFRSRWGLQVRATVQNRVMANAVGINTARSTAPPLRSAAASPAWPARPSPPSAPPGPPAARSTSSIPSWWWSSAARKPARHRGLGLRHRADAVHSEFFLTGSMAKVLTLSAVILILMLRPQGLFSAKVRK
jgi:urea transport system permease protein